MISFVIPVFRSAASLPALCERISAVCAQERLNFEIVFVEDGGKDSSWLCIQELAATDHRIRGYQLSRNFGQHAALLCGIRAAQGEIIVTLDDDLQHPPEEIPKLLEKLAEGYDVVYGPPQQVVHGWARSLASKITKFTLQHAMGAANAAQISALRVFRAQLRDAFTTFHGPAVNIDVLLTWATKSFAAVRVRHDARQHGVSGYTAYKLLQHAVNMLTGFSTRPLQIVSVFGFCVAVFGVAVLGYVLFAWLMHGSAVPGFAFLASIIAIFAGAQLIALGVIGEYLARMYMRTVGQPAYVVASDTAKAYSHEGR